MAKNGKTGGVSVKSQAYAGISQEQIAKRAYEKFMARGGAHGYDQQDWLDAERELKSEFRRGDNN